MKALVRLCGCTDSPEPSLFAYVVSNLSTCAGSTDDNSSQNCGGSIQNLVLNAYLSMLGKVP